MNGTAAPDLPQIRLIRGTAGDEHSETIAQDSLATFPAVDAHRLWEPRPEVGGSFQSRSVDATWQIIDVEDRPRPSPIVEHVRRAKITKPDEIEILYALKQAAANIAIDSTPEGIANARVQSPLQLPPQTASESRLYLY